MTVPTQTASGYQPLHTLPDDRQREALQLLELLAGTGLVHFRQLYPVRVVVAARDLMRAGYVRLVTDDLAGTLTVVRKAARP